MSITFRGIPTKQPLGEFYTCVISSSDLLTISAFDYRKLVDEEGDPDFMGIQRPYSPTRVKEISDYLKTVDACFPTSVVISVDERCVAKKNISEDIFEINISPYEDPIDPENSVALDKAAAIIDGQHRLKGLEAAHPAEFQLSVTMFVGADEATRASLFSVVNLAQTKVNRSLVYDLFAVAEERSPQKTCHNITVTLDKLPDSPFYRRIKRLGTATEGREGETLSQATVVRGIMQYISSNPMEDRDRSLREEATPPADPKRGRKLILREFYRNKEDDSILDLMLNYFGAIRARWPTAWESDERGDMIIRTNGFDGFMKFFRHAYSEKASAPRLVQQDEFAETFARSSLQDADFNTSRFPPGSSGASELYKALFSEAGPQQQLL